MTDKISDNQVKRLAAKGWVFLQQLVESKSCGKIKSKYWTHNSQLVRKKSCIAGLRYLQIRSDLCGAMHLNSVMWKPLPSLNLRTADATNSSVPCWVSVCQLNAKLLLCSPGSNNVVDGCFPGVWPSMHSQRPWQLPHARLSAALYRPLQVLNPPWCSFKRGGGRPFTPRSIPESVYETMMTFTQIQKGFNWKRWIFLRLNFLYAQLLP